MAGAVAVPDTSLKHVLPCARDIAQRPGAKTKVLYVDHMTSNSQGTELRKLQEAVQADHSCQDIWHVQHRISQTMMNSHPSYGESQRDLGAVFLFNDQADEQKIDGKLLEGQIDAKYSVGNRTIV